MKNNNPKAPKKWIQKLTARQQWRHQTFYSGGGGAQGGGAQQFDGGTTR